MKIKATRYLDTPIRMAKIQDSGSTQTLVRTWSDRNSFIAGGKAKQNSHFGKQFGNSFQTKLTPTM